MAQNNNNTTTMAQINNNTTDDTVIAESLQTAYIQEATNRAKKATMEDAKNAHIQALEWVNNVLRRQLRWAEAKLETAQSQIRTLRKEVTNAESVQGSVEPEPDLGSIMEQLQLGLDAESVQGSVEPKPDLGSIMEQLQRLTAQVAGMQGKK